MEPKRNQAEQMVFLNPIIYYGHKKMTGKQGVHTKVAKNNPNTASLVSTSFKRRKNSPW